MLENLQALIEQSGDNLDIVLRHADGGAVQCRLQAADITGVMVESGDGIIFYPWTAIKRIRIK